MQTINASSIPEKVKKGIAMLFFSFLLYLPSCRSVKQDEPVFKDPRPNIILFLTNDSDFSYWGFGNGPSISPTIDSLSSCGIQATEFYCTSSSSKASRYSLHTGMYPGRCLHNDFLTQYPENSSYAINDNVFLDYRKEYTLGKMFQKAGYKTGFVGKWDMGVPKKINLPENANIFEPETDKKIKLYQSDIINYIKNSGYDYASSIVPESITDTPLEELRFHNLEWYARGAIQFIQKYQKQQSPFFLIVNLSTHHLPCHIESVNSEIRLTQAGITDSLKNIMPPRRTLFKRIMEKGYPLDFKTVGTLWTDDCIGSILDKLNDFRLSNNSVIIFTTDNNRAGGSSTCYQKGVHIPFIMKWPGIIQPGSYTDQRITMPDLLPTLAEIAEAKLPQDIIFDGHSKLDILIHPETKNRSKDILYFENGYSRAVLVDKFKYIALRFPNDLLQNMKSGQVEKSYALNGKLYDDPAILNYPYYFDADQLFNLAEDPNEQYNLAYDSEYQGKLRQMKEIMKNFTSGFRNPFPVDNPDPFYNSSEYKILNEKAREIDLNKYSWYRKGCY